MHGTVFERAGSGDLDRLERVAGKRSGFFPRLAPPTTLGLWLFHNP
jgi:hypothetical protein